MYKLKQPFTEFTSFTLCCTNHLHIIYLGRSFRTPTTINTNQLRNNRSVNKLLSKIQACKRIVKNKIPFKDVNLLNRIAVSEYVGSSSYVHLRPNNILSSGKKYDQINTPYKMIMNIPYVNSSPMKTTPVITIVFI